MCPSGLLSKEFHHKDASLSPSLGTDRGIQLGMDGCQPIRQFSLALALFSASVALLLNPDDTQKPLHTVSSVVPEFSLFEPGLIALGGGGVGSLHWVVVVVWVHCTG